MRRETVSSDISYFYVDNFSITLTPLGVTLTFLRSAPAVADVSEATEEIVARVRFSPEGIKGLTEFLAGALAQATQAGATTIKH